MAPFGFQCLLWPQDPARRGRGHGLRLVEPTPRRENLGRYIIRASFSQERMIYFPEDSKVVYRSKDGKEEKIFDALEWLAAMCSHVPNKGEQMVRYYG
jgi:hypothetical protein